MVAIGQVHDAARADDDGLHVVRAAAHGRLAAVAGRGRGQGGAGHVGRIGQDVALAIGFAQVGEFPGLGDVGDALFFGRIASQLVIHLVVADGGLGRMQFIEAHLQDARMGGAAHHGGHQRLLARAEGGRDGGIAGPCHAGERQGQRGGGPGKCGVHATSEVSGMACSIARHAISRSPTGACTAPDQDSF